jgi:hypothetical protein
MNTSLLPSSASLLAFATLWLIVLNLLVRFSRLPTGLRNNALLAVAAVLLLLVPVGGLPVWRWLFSLYPNPCLPMLGVLVAQHGPRFLGLRLFAETDWNATWRFGAVVGTVVFLHPVLLGGVDFYYWGWNVNLAAWLIAAVAITFLALGNHFGLLLAGSLVVFLMGGLESKNGWDYVIDPIFWIASLVSVIRRDLVPAMVKAVRRGPSAQPHADGSLR